MYGYGGWWMMPFMLLCFAIIILVIVLSMRFFSKPNTSYDNKKALDILDEKLATGEISEEDYQRKKQMILRK